ncbi:MAG: hypothetical protein JWN28_614 [Candidatus Saccharibacteria bacterium]|nr:hypothetical protein [Candidatus Saccharibacteria bacterium]
MGEFLNKSEQEKYDDHHTGVDINDLSKWLSSRTTEQARQRQQQPQQRQQPQPRPVVQPAPETRPKNDTPAPRAAENNVTPGKKNEHLRKIVKKSSIAALAIAVVAGGAYGFNLGGVRDNATSALDNLKFNFNNEDITEVSPLETLGVSPFDPDTCDKPEKTILAVSLSGEIAEEILLADANSATPIKQKPYLTEENINKQAEGQAVLGNGIDLRKFVTNSGFPEVTLNNIPFGVNICDPTGSIEVQGDFVTVDRSKLVITFRDPKSLFDIDMQIQYQNDGAYVDADPHEGEFMTFPNPEYGLFLKLGKDEVFNAAREALVASYADSAQQQTMYQYAKIKAIQELSEVLASQDNIDLPGDALTVEKAIDNAIIQQIVGNPKVPPLFKGGSYKLLPDVPLDDATKMPAATVTPPVGFATDNKFNIRSAKITIGALQPLDVEVPTKSPTSTPEPMPTVAP